MTSVSSPLNNKSSFLDGLSNPDMSFDAKMKKTSEMLAKNEQVINEIKKASEYDVSSFAVSKREEMERIAASSR